MATGIALNLNLIPINFHRTICASADIQKNTCLKAYNIKLTIRIPCMYNQPWNIYKANSEHFLHRLIIILLLLFNVDSIFLTHWMYYYYYYRCRWYIATVISKFARWRWIWLRLTVAIRTQVSSLSVTRCLAAPSQRSSSIATCSCSEPVSISS